MIVHYRLSIACNANLGFNSGLYVSLLFLCMHSGCQLRISRTRMAKYALI